MKYFQLLNDIKKIDCETEALIFLITEISGLDKSKLFLNLDQEINNDILNKIKSAIKIFVKDRIPVQYIIGYTYFYGLKIHVNKNVLIPRNETEEVVEKVIQISKEFENPKILDVGTGSGCIALALKTQIPTATISAIDISDAALDVAKMNADYHNLNINFHKNDLLEDFNGNFDIIVSNPPYIDKDEKIMDLVYQNEPHLALFSKNKGLYHYHKILKKAKNVLNDNGVIVFEIAYNKKDEMITLANKYFTNINVLKDNHNKNRIMIIR